MRRSFPFPFLVPLLAASLAVLLAAPGAAQDRVGGSGGLGPGALEWNRRNAEHLLNRAGFGAREGLVARALRIGPEALVNELLAGPAEPRAPFFAERLSNKDGGMQAMEARLERLGQPVDLDLVRSELRARDRQQLFDYATDWIGHMVGGSDPLRDRMTLFWHGHFTSSMSDVKSSYKMIRQHQFLFENALGSFEVLLRGIARDPAMLEYLDNRTNRREEPNENFARELLELFTLGEGNYTELDVQQVARAFTGWTDKDAEFLVRRKIHDDGIKHVLGQAGRYDGDSVIDILLAEDACARWIAGRIVRWFEGVEPDPARLEGYASLLRAADWDVSALLRELFQDPAFYRDEVVGTRVAGPIDFLVGGARRLGLDGAETLILAGAQVNGEQLFYPPSVKGWDGGPAWITTSSLMQRGNLAGALLGLLPFDEAVAPGDVEPEAAPEAAMEASMQPAMEGMVPPSMARSEGDGGVRSASESTDPGEGGDEDGDLAPDLEPPAPRPPIPRAIARYLRDHWRPRPNLSARFARELEPGDGTGDEALADALLAELLAIEPTAWARQWTRTELARERVLFGAPDAALSREETEELLRRVAHLVLSLPEAQLH